MSQVPEENILAQTHCCLGILVDLLLRQDHWSVVNSFDLFASTWPTLSHPFLELMLDVLLICVCHFVEEAVTVN